MSHYQPYPAYKDSGVEWLGVVPEHWAVMSIKHIVSTPITDGPHETPNFVDEGIPFVSAEAVSSGNIDFSKIRGFITEADHRQYSQKYHPERGDIFMIKSGATTGITAIVETDIDFNIWSPLAVIRCGERSMPRFVLNFMRSKSFQEAVALNWSFGTQQNIGMGVIGDIAITVPSIAEQQTIAVHLDRETTRIDGLVSKKTRFIGLLREKRQALITHAVTKGLDPNVKMKDSGVEWLGDIPEHWDVLSFQRCVSVAEGQVDPKISPFREMVLLGPNHIESGSGRVLFTETAEDQHAESGKYICEEGNIVYSKIRPALRKVCIAPMRCLCSADMYPLHTHSGMSNAFLFWFLLSEPFSAFAVLESDRVAMPKINRESLNGVLLPRPSIENQSVIAVYLDHETTRIDTLISKTKLSIDLLKERRSALITAAVTGQIDLREVA